MERINKNSTYNYSFIDWFLPLFMILAQYKIGTSFSNYGYLIIAIYAIYLMFIKNTKLYFHKYLLLLTIYVIIITIINYIRLDGQSINAFNSLITQVVLFIVISLVITQLHIENFYKSYLFFGSIAMLIIYFQSIRLLVFGIPAIPITILPIDPKDAHFWGNFLGKRPSGLFTEPQAYASFMFPLLILSLKKKKKFLVLIISLSLLLSTSSQGIIVTGIIFIYYLLWGNIKTYQKVLISLLFTFSIYALLNLKIFEFATNKIAKTDLENNIRLVRGFMVYSNFDLTDLLLGINDNLQSYILKNLRNSYWVTEHIKFGAVSGLSYTTTVSGILIQSGFFAGILFILMIYKMYKYEDPSNRIFLVLIFILSFSQTIFYNAWFVFYYIIYLGLNNKRAYNINYTNA